LLKLAADENFNNRIIRGILRRKPGIDIVRIQDAGLSGARDPIILEWAEKEDRVLLTHDVSTITGHA
jgi:predicted nuclease of predicted toxin-antitoxin system